MAQQGLFDLGDGVFKGKGVDALKASKQGSSALIALFGGSDNMPSSIMRHKKGKRDRDEDGTLQTRNYRQSGSKKADRSNHKISKFIRDHFGMSGQGCSSGALSTFSQNIGRSVVLFYSNPGDTVFDPFAGHNSRMELCVKAGRHYTGCDLSTEFMQFNHQRAEQLRKKYQAAQIKLHHGDSRKIPVKKNTGDFTITSPPYWDIEYYGDEPEQMGKCPTYREFLDAMQLVMNENFRILKPGAFAAWFINDFRKKGKFYSYHVDIIRLGKRAGFIHHDLLIVDLGRSIRDCFANQTMQTKILPKRHEFGVIFRKP